MIKKLGLLLASILVAVVLVNPNAAQAQVAPGSEYVALGDSYGSGWGANRTPAGLDPSANYSQGESCGRSNKAMQVLLASEWQLSLINGACGGANTSNFLTTGQKGEPPQLDRLTPATKLLTFTIGGNDTSLIWILDQCVRTTSFLCWGGINGASMQSQYNKKVLALGPKLHDVYTQAVNRSPGVKIRHAGYPYIVAPTGPVGTCTWMSTTEQAAFADMTRKTNDKIRESVDAFRAETGADIAYVDPMAADSPFMVRDNGILRDSCSSSPQRYMNNVTEVSLTYGGWHPNIFGQQIYEQLLKTSVN